MQARADDSAYPVHIRLLAEAPFPAQQQSIAGATVWLRPPYSSGSYASLASQLSSSNASAGSSPVQILGVQGMSKIGVHGNGKCEIGELPSPDNAGAQLLLSLPYLQYRSL